MSPGQIILMLSLAVNGLLGWAYLGQRDKTTAARGEVTAMQQQRDGARGVAVTGRPVARGLDDGLTCEVTRLCTEGTPNACSMLYAASRRVAEAKGYRRGLTYILASETGASLRAAGWRPLWTVKGRSWDCPSRPRTDKHPTEDKQAWGWGAWPERANQ